MQTRSTTSTRSGRRPLNVFGRLSLIAALGCALSSGILALSVGFPDNTALLIITAVLLIVAGLIFSGLRWIPPLVSVMSVVFVFQIINQPFVSYHLANPKTGGFLAFVLDMLIIGFTVVMLGTSIGASILNYRPGLDTGQAPRWLPATLTGVAGLLIGAILMAGLAPGGAAPTTTTYTNGVPTVHMSAGNFTQTSITIAKGSKLLVVDDVSIMHILANGTWSNGVAQPTREPGAPSIANLQLQGNSATIGPFTTAGTYQIYCTVHQGMNLTVIVQ